MPTEHQCTRKRGFGPGGLYCRPHNPEALAEKRAAEDAARKRHNEDQERIEREGRWLARALDVKGEANYRSAFRFKDCGLVEELVISFADARRLIERLEKARV